MSGERTLQERGAASAKALMQDHLANEAVRSGSRVNKGELWVRTERLLGRLISP